jgi:hypothetical protein
MIIRCSSHNSNSSDASFYSQGSHWYTHWGPHLCAPLQVITPMLRHCFKFPFSAQRQSDPEPKSPKPSTDHSILGVCHPSELNCSQCGRLSSSQPEIVLAVANNATVDPAFSGVCQFVVRWGGHDRGGVLKFESSLSRLSGNSQDPATVGNSGNFCTGLVVAIWGCQYSSDVGYRFLRSQSCDRRTFLVWVTNLLLRLLS